MRSSSIYIKFHSEAKYERLTFTSEVVTFNEIKQHLEKKKHVCKDYTIFNGHRILR